MQCSLSFMKITHFIMWIILHKQCYQSQSLLLLLLTRLSLHVLLTSFICLPFFHIFLSHQFITLTLAYYLTIYSSLSHCKSYLFSMPFPTLLNLTGLNNLTLFSDPSNNTIPFYIRLQLSMFSSYMLLLFTLPHPVTVHNPLTLSLCFVRYLLFTLTPPPPQSITVSIYLGV